MRIVALLAYAVRTVAFQNFMTFPSSWPVGASRMASISDRIFVIFRNLRPVRRYIAQPDVDRITGWGLLP